MMPDALPGLPPVLSNWGLDAPGDEIVSFGAPGEAASPQAAVWRVDLPTDAGQADLLLDGMAAELTRVEAALQDLPEQLAVELPGEEMVSFAGPSPEKQAAGAAFQQALEKVTRQFLYLAWVETRVDGVLLARSVMDWNGDLVTGWVDPSGERQAQHFKSLQVALSSRLALLKLILTVIREAGRISALAANPAGLILALPSAWRLASQLLARAGQSAQSS